LQLGELDQAESIGEQLVNAVGTREQAPAVAAEVTQQRQRMFTLFLNSYDQVRRAVTYLRWNEGDIDTVAPSLYAGRAARKKPDEPAPAPTPPTPVVAPVKAGGVTPSPEPVVSVAKPPAGIPIVPAGLPGSSSFAGN
jgi:hypothetical protein